MNKTAIKELRDFLDKYLLEYYTNNKIISFNDKKIILNQIVHEAECSLDGIENEKQMIFLSPKSIIYSAIEDKSINLASSLDIFDPNKDLDIFPDIVIKITKKDIKVYEDINITPIFEFNIKILNPNSDNLR